MYKDINIGFTRHEHNGIVYYTVPSFMPYVDFAFCGDISNNLSFKAIREVEQSQVVQGYKKLCDCLNMDYTKAVMTNIVHKDNIMNIDSSHCGYGITKNEILKECDALITNKSGIPIASTHADCMPISLYSIDKNVGCVIHSGWRGVYLEIYKNAIKIMQNEFNCNNIIVAIGPTIMQCCFEVGNDVSCQFEQKFGSGYIDKTGMKHKIDLLSIVLDGIISMGIQQNNITIDGRCTCEINSGLHSFRRDKQKAGTMVQIMQIR